MSFYGDDINRFFFGTVINDNDADLLLGRVQVRVYGIHGEEIPNSDLPWAQTMLPSTEPGIGGIGSAPMIKSGAQVFGVFLDGTHSQIPLVLGSIPKIMIPTSSQLNAYSGGGALGGGGGGADTGQAAESYSNSGTAVAVGSLEGSTNAEKIYRFLTNKGFTPEQACAVIGHFNAESGLNPEAYNPDDKGLPSFGLAQWRDDRYADLKNYAASINQDYRSLECQLGFFLFELQNKEKSAGIKIKSSRTITEAVLAMASFERYEDWKLGLANGNTRSRLATAEDAYRRFA